jgi:phenylacetic acid degradation operon negative regulatory protein
VFRPELIQSLSVHIGSRGPKNLTQWSHLCKKFCVMTDRRSPPALERAAAQLLNRVRRARPLRAGSLIVTILGDAIVPRGGSVSLASLIRLAAPFGLSERLVRTSVGRLALDGWLRAARHGRLSYYALTALGRARFAAATRRIYAGSPVAWDGRWTLVLAPAGDSDLREELLWQGYGAIAAGVLARPAPPENGAARALRRRAALVFSAATGAGFDRALIRASWDLPSLARRYRRFVALFAPVGRALERSRPIAPETAFMLRTLLVHEYRKIHLRDPLLPQSLLPRTWIGNAAYSLCRELYSAVFPAAEAYLNAQAARRGGALPPPAAATYQRFGGLPRPATHAS